MKCTYCERPIDVCPAGRWLHGIEDPMGVGDALKAVLDCLRATKRRADGPVVSAANDYIEGLVQRNAGGGER